MSVSSGRKKFGSNVDSMYYENRLLEIDLTFRECDEILEEASVNAGEKLKRGITDYEIYIDSFFH